MTPYSKPGSAEGSLLCTPCGKKTAGQDKEAVKKKVAVKRQKKQNMKNILDGEGVGAKSLRELAINVSILPVFHFN